MLQKLKPHLQYLWYLLRHKWFVFIAGRKTGAPLWRLIIHDWTKFTPAEWPAYVQKFYGLHKDTKDHGKRHGSACHLCFIARKIKEDFTKAWEHHWLNNPHHWEYWDEKQQAKLIYHPHWMYEDELGPPLMMTYPYVREMVADWAGAGRGITGKWEVRKWYEENKQKIRLHPDTRWYVEGLLATHF